MLTVSAPPRPPRADDPEALFEEARRRRRWLRVAAAAAALIAAGAGTYAGFGDGTAHPSTVPVFENGVLTSVPNQTVVLLVDVSGSMRATDVSPTRLGATVSAMRTLVGRLPSRFQVGVVSFSTTATVVQAPTRDRGLVFNALRSLTPEAGTGLGDGVAAAVKLTVATLAGEGIRRTPGHDLPAVIVLESDGAQNRGAITPLQAAMRASAAGVRIDGVALGTPHGRVQFGPTGQVMQQIAMLVPPDPKTVGQIAQVTGGVSFTAPTATRLQAIFSSLATSIAR